MADKSKIEWTEATWNPVRGCSRVSEGCRNCYAERVAARFSGPGQAYEGLAVMKSNGPHWTGEVRLVSEHLEDPIRWREPRRIFVNSMSDLFHESLSDADIMKVWSVIVSTQFKHTYQVLTKRPERMRDWVKKYAPDFVSPCLWLGVSVENQETADERIPLLLETPAAVRWISAEPLLGPINLAQAGLEICMRDLDAPDEVNLDWVVVGGESGPGARPMRPEWARSLRDQCEAAGVSFFFKQWGEWGPVYRDGSISSEGAGSHGAFWQDGRLTVFKRGESHGEVFRVGKKKAGRLLDGELHNEFPVPAHGAQPRER